MDKHKCKDEIVINHVMRKENVNFSPKRNEILLRSLSVCNANFACFGKTEILIAVSLNLCHVTYRL